MVGHFKLLSGDPNAVYSTILDSYRSQDALIEAMLLGRPDFIFGTFCASTGFLQNEEVFNRIYPYWHEILTEGIHVHYRNEWRKLRAKRQFSDSKYFIKSFCKSWLYEVHHVLRKWYDLDYSEPFRASVMDPDELYSENDPSVLIEHLELVDDRIAPLKAILTNEMSNEVLYLRTKPIPVISSPKRSSL